VVILRAETVHALRERGVPQLWSASYDDTGRLSFRMRIDYTYFRRTIPHHNINVIPVVSAHFGGGERLRIRRLWFFVVVTATCLVAVMHCPPSCLGVQHVLLCFRYVAGANLAVKLPRWPKIASQCFVH
jgi:hypothetical protein